MSFIVVIPARYASQRLPGKPLIDLAGKTMIRRVYECAQKSDAARVIVATDDERILQEVNNFGGEVVMTSENHASGTDRLQEVVTNLALEDSAVVVNVQGDEPMIPASVINQVAKNLESNDSASAATLCEPITDIDTAFDVNAVKVVTDNKGFALYFSRATIPWVRDNFDSASPSLSEQDCVRRHIGIYAYRVKLLHEFVEWPMSSLEAFEKLEQLRILSNGQKIHVEQANAEVPGGVDTAEDWQCVKDFFAKKN